MAAVGLAVAEHFQLQAGRLAGLGREIAGHLKKTAVVLEANLSRQAEGRTTVDIFAPQLTLGHTAHDLVADETQLEGAGIIMRRVEEEVHGSVHTDEPDLGC